MPSFDTIFVGLFIFQEGFAYKIQYFMVYWRAKQDLKIYPAFTEKWWIKNRLILVEKS